MSPASSVPWSVADIPDLTGRRALVTGVTSGLGESIALELARAGAEVVLAARSAQKLAATVADIRRQLPTAELRTLRIDLADLTSVRHAAAEASALGPLHLLVNNAGVMAPPYQRTVDGFELQLATNHLGPFALTGLLLPSLVASGDGRVVSTASQAHRMARRAPLDDPRVQHGRYSRWQSYGQSKLAALLFTFELDRRLRAADLPVKALAAHPGFAATGLMATTLGVTEAPRSPVERVLLGAFGMLGQPAKLGALPTLMAATADLPGASYVGPRDMFQMRGAPKLVKPRRLARNAEAQRQLWEVSENATGVRYP